MESVPEEHFLKVLESKKFLKWTSEFSNAADVRSLKVLLVYMFGKANVGFVNLEVEAYLDN